MSSRAPLLLALVLTGIATLGFHLFQRQLSATSLAFGPQPEVLAQLEASLADQRRLAHLEPTKEDTYRARFDEIETTVRRLRILDHSREALTRRYEEILLAIFAAVVVLVTGVYAYRQSRDQPRLARIQEAVTALAEGRTDLDLGERRRDAIGRIAAMIERASGVMSRDRRRLAALDNLAAWQEAARRQAHELRTPLTGLKLELERAREGAAAGGDPGEIERAIAAATREANRLGELARRFTSFARLPAPRPETRDLAALVQEWVDTYRDAWPNLQLESAVAPPCQAEVDRDMIREVLVNLCDNASVALGERTGTVHFTLTRDPDGIHLDVADDGPGVPEQLRGRLFEPYVTSRTVGKGMGLGLAIAKKALLDHGGDLELAASSDEGSTFRLTFPPTAGESP